MSKKIILSAIALAAATSAVAAEAKSTKKVHTKKVHEVKETVEPVVSHSDVKVTLGADLEVQAGSVKQSKAYKYVTPTEAPVATSAKTTDKAIVNNNKVNVAVDGHSKGLKYGGKVVLNANASDNKQESNKHSAAEASVYVEHAMGRLEAGSLEGVTSKMTAAPKVVATGGASHGDYTAWMNSKTLSQVASEVKVSENFVTEAYLPLDASFATRNANKVSVMTPSWMGLQLGLSYTPDASIKGTTSSLNSVDSNNASSTKPAYKNVLSAVVGFSNAMNGVDLKASLAAQSGSVKKFQTVSGTTTKVEAHGLKAWEGALSLGYKGFTLGGTYGKLGKSGLSKASTVKGHKDSSYYSAALGYDYGSLGVSLSYFESKMGGAKTATTNTDHTDKTNNAKVWALGAEYKLAQGLLPYAEVSKFDYKQARVSGKATTNKGTVVLVGTKLSF